MNKQLLLGAFASVVFFSCSDDSVSEEFNNANGGVAKKYIEKIEFESQENADENITLTIQYDANGRVTGASNGEDTATLTYADNQLSTISGADEPFSLSELYQEPYDAFEEGDVLDYDDAGNPIQIKVIDYDYEYVDGEYIETPVELEAIITYDATPNPFFYTFEAAGLIDVMDRVEINFSMMPQSAEIVKARALFPVNNIKSITYKDENGDIIGELIADYNYDNDNYPISATFTVKVEGEADEVSTVDYYYKS